MDAIGHEREYRGAEAIEKISSVVLTVCGAGAIGSNLVDNLARQGFANFNLIDCDRVEEHNVGTQRYGRHQVGMLKVPALENMLWNDIALVAVGGSTLRLEESNVRKLLRGAGIIVDSFDNSASRRLVQDYAIKNSVPCLHVGLDAEYAEVIWDPGYKVPEDRPDLDACEYPLARNVIMVAVALASESLIDFVLTGEQKSYRFTLRDRRVTRV